MDILVLAPRLSFLPPLISISIPVLFLSILPPLLLPYLFFSFLFFLFLFLFVLIFLFGLFLLQFPFLILAICYCFPIRLVSLTAHGPTDLTLPHFFFVLFLFLSFPYLKRELKNILHVRGNINFGK